MSTTENLDSPQKPAISSVMQTEEKYTDASGAAATNLFGVFFGFVAFALFCLFQSIRPGESPFPLIKNLKQLSQMEGTVYVVIGQIIFAVAFLIHHWRVFAGFAFTHNTAAFKPFLDSLNTRPKKIVFRAIKTLFVVTFPLFVLLSRSPFVFWFKTIWIVQAAFAVIFICYFWDEMLALPNGKSIRWTIIVADSGFLFLSVAICILTSLIPNPVALAFTVGIVFAITVTTVVHEFPTYLDSFRKIIKGTYLYTIAAA